MNDKNLQQGPGEGEAQARFCCETEPITKSVVEFGGSSWVTLCGVCGFATGYVYPHASKASSVAAWNRRAPVAAVSGEDQKWLTGFANNWRNYREGCVIAPSWFEFLSGGTIPRIENLLRIALAATAGPMEEVEEEVFDDSDPFADDTMTTSAHSAIVDFVLDKVPDADINDIQDIFPLLDAFEAAVRADHVTAPQPALVEGLGDERDWEAEAARKRYQECNSNANHGVSSGLERAARVIDGLPTLAAAAPCVGVVEGDLKPDTQFVVFAGREDAISVYEFAAADKAVEYLDWASSVLPVARICRVISRDVATAPAPAALTLPSAAWLRAMLWVAEQVESGIEYVLVGPHHIARVHTGNETIHPGWEKCPITGPIDPALINAVEAWQSGKGGQE